MKMDKWTGDVLERLAEVRERCPEMRFGQILATVGLLGEDETGHSLWDIEDAEFAAALERFRTDLVHRSSEPAERADGPERRMRSGVTVG